MKNLFKIRNFALIALFALLTVSCDDDNDEDNTITGKASANVSLSILSQALVRADLATTLRGSGPYTVFAPTNQAFTTFLAARNYATINDVPKEALTQILLNHVVTGSVKSTNLTTGYIKTLAKGSASTTNTLSMYVNITSGVKLNGIATVTTADVMASNGVIHIVDRVLDLPTIVTHVSANSNFSTLAAALNRPGAPDFIAALSATGPFTVFAPTNTAFSLLNEEFPTGFTSANLTKVIEYHVVNSNVLSASLTEGQVITPILIPSQTFTIQLSGGAKIKDRRDRITNISTTIRDVQCSNGVIHAVERVLLPTF